LPSGDRDYPGRWKAIKSSFSRSLEKSGILVEKRQDGSTLVWQRRYWEHTIRDDDDLNRHIDYIHMNPVKHGWAKRVADLPKGHKGLIHRSIGMFDMGIRGNFRCHMGRTGM
jgi:putative transposase